MLKITINRTALK